MRTRKWIQDIERDRCFKIVSENVPVIQKKTWPGTNEQGVQPKFERPYRLKDFCSRVEELNQLFNNWWSEIVRETSCNCFSENQGLRGLTNRAIQVLYTFQDGISHHVQLSSKHYTVLSFLRNSVCIIWERGTVILQLFGKWSGPDSTKHVMELLGWSSPIGAVARTEYKS